MSDSFPSFQQTPQTGVIYSMAEAQRMGYHPRDWSNLGQGAPETGVLDGAPKRLENIAVNCLSSEYSPVAGDMELREAIADLYNTRYRRGLGSKYGAENVSIASGGRAALTRIATVLGHINMGHFLPDYTAYEELLDIFRTFIPIPIVLSASESFQIGTDQLRAEIEGRGLGALLFSNPSNPTGHVVKSVQLAEWVALATKGQCALIVDEFYSHYHYGGGISGSGEDTTRSVAACIDHVDKQPVVIIDGLTKNWRYPGLRLSWTLAPKKIIERIASAGSFLDGGPPHPIQKAAIELVSLEHAQSEALAIQKSFRVKRQEMIGELERLGFILGEKKPTGAFYCFPSLENLPPPLNDGMSFFREALKKKVIVVPGEFFDVDPGNRRRQYPSRLKGYVRISYGPSQREVRQGLHRLGELIEEAKNVH